MVDGSVDRFWVGLLDRRAACWSPRLWKGSPCGYVTKNVRVQVLSSNLQSLNVELMHHRGCLVYMGSGEGKKTHTNPAGTVMPAFRPTWLLSGIVCPASAAAAAATAAAAAVLTGSKSSLLRLAPSGIYMPSSKWGSRVRRRLFVGLATHAAY